MSHAGPTGGGKKAPTALSAPIGFWSSVSAFKTRAVTCGLEHSCAWGEGGRVVCWGDNAVSQLGPKAATF